MKKVLPLIILLALGVVGGVGGTLIYQQSTGPKQTVNVNGQGSLEAPADQVTISITIASKNSAEDLQTLKEKLLQLGIPESRMTQGSADIYPMMGITTPGMMVPPTPPSDINPALIYPGKILPTVTLTVVLDNLSGIDSVFAAISSVPTAKISGTNYSLKNSATYESQAREKAVQDARNQAETIAKINHLRVGKLLNLSSMYEPTPMYKEGTVGVMRSAGQSGPGQAVSYGEKTITINASFNVQYELY